MNKTIFNLDSKISIIMIAVLGIIFSFMTNAFYVVNFWGFILYFFRFCLFAGIYLLFYFAEKNNLVFKSRCKVMGGYLLVNASINIACALFSVTHILKDVFLLVSGIMCFWSILAFMGEIMILFIERKWLKRICDLNEKIGSIFINPIVKIFEKKITND